LRYCVIRRGVTPLGAWGHCFIITDEAGAVCYRAEVRYRPIAATTTFRDAAGKQLLPLKFRHLLLGRGCFIMRDGEDAIAASLQVQRDLTIQGPELQIRVPDELDLVGSLDRHEYYLMRATSARSSTKEPGWVPLALSFGDDSRAALRATNVPLGAGYSPIRQNG
jgi:hypothetical protein